MNGMTMPPTGAGAGRGSQGVTADLPDTGAGAGRGAVNPPNVVPSNAATAGDEDSGQAGSQTSNGLAGLIPMSNRDLIRMGANMMASHNPNMLGAMGEGIATTFNEQDKQKAAEAENALHRAQAGMYTQHGGAYESLARKYNAASDPTIIAQVEAAKKQGKGAITDEDVARLASNAIAKERTDMSSPLNPLVTPDPALRAQLEQQALQMYASSIRGLGSSSGTGTVAAAPGAEGNGIKVIGVR